jgi:hypothetical protein
MIRPVRQLTYTFLIGLSLLFFFLRISVVAENINFEVVGYPTPTIQLKVGEKIPAPTEELKVGEKIKPSPIELKVIKKIPATSSSLTIYSIKKYPTLISTNSASITISVTIPPIVTGPIPITHYPVITGSISIKPLPIISRSILIVPSPAVTVPIPLETNQTQEQITNQQGPATGRLQTLRYNFGTIVRKIRMTLSRIFFTH